MAFGLRVFKAASDPIPATGELAAIGTSIRCDLVTIIAFFLGFDLAVAAFARNVPYDDLFARAGKGKDKG